MPGSHVDVNLHPTKREVGFLHQDELLEAIRGAIEETLLTSNDKSVHLNSCNIVDCIVVGLCSCGSSLTSCR